MQDLGHLPHLHHHHDRRVQRRDERLRDGTEHDAQRIDGAQQLPVDEARAARRGFSASAASPSR